jgi:hypothetical protein
VQCIHLILTPPWLEIERQIEEQRILN